MTIQDRVGLGRADYPPRDTAMAERDRMLVQAHLRRDADAFAIIVDDHRPALLAQARRMLGPDGSAEDVVQETFVRALRGVDRFGRTGEYRLGAWLNQILRNVVHDHRAKASREQLLARNRGHLIRPEADVADRVGDPVVAAALSAAVLDLPSGQRDAFVMREMVGFSYPDVAEALNISEENARARVSRSKGRLRRVTADLRSAAGALVAVPAGVLAHLIPGRLRRPKGGVLRAGDGVAVQLTSSPLSQTALSVVTSAPRGAFVIGVAATVATLSAGTVALTSQAAVSHPAATTAFSSLASDQTPTVTSPPAPTSPTPPPTPPAASPAASTYGWVNPTSSSAPAAVAWPASCVSDNGVVPPAPGTDVGPQLGLSNAVAVASTTAVELDTVGPWFSFTSSAAVNPFGQSGATPASVAANACIFSSGGYFTANISGIGGESIQLQGVLEETVGSAGALAYVFRGSVTPNSELPEPLAGAVQFVAEVSIPEPQNTAQVTIVFLGPTPNASTTASVESSTNTGVAPATTTASQPTSSSQSSDSSGSEGTGPGMTGTATGLGAGATVGSDSPSTDSQSQLLGVLESSQSGLDSQL